MTGDLSAWCGSRVCVEIIKSVKDICVANRQTLKKIRASSQTGFVSVTLLSLLSVASLLSTVCFLPLLTPH